MSKLKFPFKFRTVMGREYEVMLKPNGDPLIRQIATGELYSRYTLVDIKTNIELGSWIIQQEEESVDSDPNVTIKQSELDALIDEINMLRELLAEAYKPTADTAPTFKPISEMTMEDWKQAKKEGWVFETRDGETAFVDKGFRWESEYPIRLSNDLSYTIGGKFYAHEREEYSADIVKRIQ